MLNFTTVFFAVFLHESNKKKLNMYFVGGPFTLSAPTNEAFNKLPPDAINKLLQNQTALIGKTCQTLRCINFHILC